MKRLTVIAALLAAMLSINACDTLLKPETKTQAPETGTVQVTLPGAGESGGAGRTIQPALTSFTCKLVFSSEDYDDVSHNLTGGGNKSFSLAQGVWYLAVDVLVGETTISRGEAGPLMVLAGKTVAAEVLLEPVNLEEGEGILDYTVNFPDGATGTLKLLSFPGGALVAEEDLVNNPSSYIEDIPAGYYQLIVSLANSERTKFAGKSDIVHIHKDKTSEFEWTFGEADFAEKRNYFISLDEMRLYLETQSVNDAINPLTVKLNVDMADLVAPALDNAANIDPLGRLYTALDGKYVDLDLSDSNGNIADGSLNYAASLASQRNNYDRIVKITLPSTLTRIGSAAFARSDMEIVFPASLKEIGDNAFSSSSISVFDFSGTALEKIGVAAFSSCNSITSLVIPRSLKGFAVQPYTQATPSASNTGAGTPNPANPFPATLPFDAISFAGTGPLSVETEDLADSKHIQYWMRTEEDGGKTLFYYRADFSSANGNTSEGSPVEITLPSGLTKLGDAVFYYSSNLRLSKVTLPDSLVHIGDFAFLEQNVVAEIELPRGLKTIGRAAFHKCASLVSMNIGDTQLESIGAFALLTGSGSGASNAGKLWQSGGDPDNSVVIFPATLKTIGDYAFGHDLYNNISAKFTKVDLSLTRLTGTGVATFARCTALEEVVLPDTLKSIGNNAFKICPVLTTINFPESLESLGATAFAGATGAANVNQHLTELDLSKTKLTRIPASSFEYNVALERVRLPPRLKYIGDYAFRYDGKIAELDIPSDSRLEVIGKQVFYSTRNATNGTVVNNVLTSLELPVSLKTLNATTFQGLTALARVTLPAGLEYVNYDTFSGCAALTEIVVTGSGPLTSADSNRMLIRDGVAFFVVPTYTGPVEIPEGVTGIRENLFRQNTRITSLTLPASLQSIGDYAFSGCTGIVGALTFPASLKSIGNYAFQSCSRITALTLTHSTSLESIGDYAFQNCTGITALTFPASLQSIGNYAFNRCKVIDGALAFPASLESIGNYAFQNCTSITALIFPASLEIIGMYAFQSCTGINTSISFPEGSSLFNIGSNAFNTCTAVPSMDFSNTKLETVDGLAFNNVHALTSIVFPATVTTFGNNMFSKSPASNLAITLKSVSPPAVMNNFISAQLRTAGTANGVYIYVPSGSVDAYKGSASPNWSTYEAVITAISGE
jgi:hypothetical protein